MSDIRTGYWDGLKGIAIVCVTIIHTGGSNLPGIFGLIGDNGKYGVQLFFIISSYFAFVSMEHAFSDRRCINLKSASYWIGKKYLRLFPLYFVALFIQIIMGGVPYFLGSEHGVSLGNVLSHVFFLHGLFPHYNNSIIGGEWYLGVLWLFYLMTPIVYKYVDSFAKALMVCVGAILICPVLSNVWFGFFPNTSDEYIYDIFHYSFGPLCQLPVLFMGMVVFFVIKSIEHIEIKNKKLLSWIFLLFSFYMLYGQMKNCNSLYSLSYDTLISVWFVLIIMGQSVCPSRIIDNPIFDTLGKYSYGIYLFQWMWLTLYDRYVGCYISKFDWTIKFFTSLIVLLIISIILTKYIDTPLRQIVMKKFFIRGDKDV